MTRGLVIGESLIDIVERDGQTDDEHRNSRILWNPLWHSNLCDRLHLVHCQNSGSGFPPSRMRTRYAASRTKR